MRKQVNNNKQAINCRSVNLGRNFPESPTRRRTQSFPFFKLTIQKSSGDFQGSNLLNK